MSDFPFDLGLPFAVHTYSDFFQMGNAHAYGLSLGVASAAWPASSTAYFFPFQIPWDYPIRRFFWANGSSTTGNCDIGVFSRDGTKLVSTGSTARSGASTIQFASILATYPGGYILPAGSYYLAFSVAATTNAVMGGTAVTAAIGRSLGHLMQATSMPLPATATFAVPTGAAQVIAGFTRLAS